MSDNNKMSNDATSSITGTIYQICIGLDRCFKLRQGQKLWIERYGDVTTSGESQLEIKFYSEPLTDSHLNFWKTLNNWLKPEFDSSQYADLVLVTNQSFGQSSKLSKWNELTAQARFDLLKEIKNESENSFEKNTKKPKPSKSLIIQKEVLASDSTKLMEVIAKISISSDSPDIQQLCETILDVYGKSILTAKRRDFLEGLLGYLMNPATIHDEWEITYDEFSAKVAVLTNAYRQQTTVFPKIKLHFLPEELKVHNEKQFAQKLREIEYAEVVSEAISNYIVANTTILEELNSYCVEHDSYAVYARNLSSAHKTNHRKAMRSVTKNNVIDASKSFYDDRTGEYPQKFARFEDIPIEFRNGVFHILADAEDDFLWRLW
ncbi:MAG: hypothetical protein WAO71_06680 [Gallionella sp.]